MKRDSKLDAAPILIMLVFLASSAYGILIEAIVAIVGDEIITLSEFNERLMMKTAQLPKDIESGKYLDEIKKIKKELLQELIAEKLILQEAKKSYIEVDENYVKNTIERLMKENDITSMEQFEQALLTEGFTLDEYKKFLNNQYKMYRLRQQYVESKITILDSQIEKYYQEHIDDYYQPKQAHLRQILLIIDPDEPQKAKKLADQLYSKLIEGEDFVQLAKEYSQGPNPKDGGDIGFVKLDDIHADYKDAILKAQSRGFTPPIEVGKAISIFQVLESKGGDAKPLAQVKDKIENKLYNMRARELFDQWIEELKGKYYLEIKYDVLNI